MSKNLKILYISNKYNKNKQGGREKLSELNFVTLKSIYEENFFFIGFQGKKLIRLKISFYHYQEILMVLTKLKQIKLKILSLKIKLLIFLLMDQTQENYLELLETII